MNRIFLIVLAAILLTGTGIVAWAFAGLPPVRMVWLHGLSYGPEPTGRTLTLEGVQFVEIGPGCFLMGSIADAESGDLLGTWCARLGLPWGDQPQPSDEMPLHWVEFPRGFWMARTELTNEHYEAFKPQNKRSDDSPGDRNPVVEIVREDAKDFCAWLSAQSGLTVRLPSESEWECACRSGSRREFYGGDDEKSLVAYAWHAANSGGQSHAVGSLRENAFGLHDLHGNVWEFCEDAYHPNYENAPTDGSARTEDDEMTEGAPCWVSRGGGWYNTAGHCRSADRCDSSQGGHSSYLGFRPAFSTPPKHTTPLQVAVDSAGECR